MASKEKKMIKGTLCTKEEGFNHIPYTEGPRPNHDDECGGAGRDPEYTVQAINVQPPQLQLQPLKPHRCSQNANMD